MIETIMIICGIVLYAGSAYFKYRIIEVIFKRGIAGNVTEIIVYWICSACTMSILHSAIDLYELNQRII